MKAGDAPGVVNNTSSIARRANRVLQVAQQEADNSEEPKFVDRVNSSIRQLRASEC
jgi:vinculin